MEPREERVLAVARRALPPHWLGQRVALRIPFEICLAALREAGARFVDRAVAEDAPGLKQLIPYLLVCQEQQGWIAVYRRGGREARLRGRWSVGLGGHVEPCDAPAGAVDAGAALCRGALRELTEELPAARARAFEFLGVVNEEESGVGRVHLGLVFRVPVEAVADPPASGELGSLEWVPVREARRRPLELWSELALDLLDRPPGRV